MDGINLSTFASVEVLHLTLSYCRKSNGKRVSKYLFWLWEIIEKLPVRVLLLTASCASSLDASQVSTVGRAYRYLNCHPHNHFWTKNRNTILRKLLIKVEFQMWYVDLTFMLMFSFCILAFKIICSVPCVTPASSQQYTLNLRWHIEREESFWE